MRRAATLSWAATMLVVAAALLLPWMAGAVSGLDGYGEWREVLLVAVFDAALGAVIVRRRPRHPIGWLLFAGGGLSALQLLAGVYSGVRPAIPGGAVAAWAAMLLQFLAVIAVVFVFQLFPTGHVLSPRWRLLPWVTAAGIALELVGMALGPGPLETAPAYDNPFGVAGGGRVLDVVEVMGFVPLMLGIVGGLVSLGLRMRRAGGVERQQIKVLFYAASVSVGALVGANVFLARQMEQTILGNLVWGGAAVSLSLAITLAMLRYRLYEIDRIISRTASYALVTAVLVVVYAVVAILPSALFGLESDLLVAAATLAAAALFVPVRRRVQAVVDRRFNRARYDAARVVDRFAGRLRDDVDLAALVIDLRRAVGTTVQPAHVSLWLPGRQPP